MIHSCANRFNLLEFDFLYTRFSGFGRSIRVAIYGAQLVVAQYGVNLAKMVTFYAHNAERIVNHNFLLFIHLGVR